MGPERWRRVERRWNTVSGAFSPVLAMDSNPNRCSLSESGLLRTVDPNAQSPTRRFSQDLSALLE
jgi:hypothetical protein